MALINCPECGKDVSDKAPSCPHCGNRIAEAVFQVTSKSLLNAGAALLKVNSLGAYRKAN